MKACVIQPPYSMDIAKSDACFQAKLDLLMQCDETVDLIVLPEYSDVPCCTADWESTYACWQKYHPLLMEQAAAAAKRCNAVVFVNGLQETESGFRNTTFAFDRSGEVVGTYYKRHLPPLEKNTLSLDSSYIDQPIEPYILTIDGIRYAFLTCYDFYFYEAFPTLAQQNPDIIIGCSLQRSDTREAIEIFNRFLCYNCNAYLVRASVSLENDCGLCGGSMIVSPRGEILANAKGEVCCVSASFDPADKYYKPAGFGNPPASHHTYIEWGRRPWNYRPAGPAMVPTDEAMPYPRVCAHRGFSTIAPENSMPAFGAAVAMGAEEIEFDLWYTADGEIVSIHDPTLERVSDGEGVVYEKTYAELLQYDFGIKHGERFKGLRILRFEEILQKFAGQVIMNIHVKEKERFDEAMLQKIIDLIDRYDCRRHVYFMTGSDEILEMAQRLAPDIHRCVGYNGCEDLEMIERAKRYGCQKIQWFKPYFGREAVQKAKALGIVNNVFWSDDPTEAIELLEMGMDVLLANDYGNVANAVKNR